MNNITTLNITALTLQNFRNHTETDRYDFSNLNLVTGHNGAGKTTIAHGICYALYGVSYYGEQKIDQLMNENASNVEVKLEFSDQDGQEHTLIRSRHHDKTQLLLDGFTARQTDIDRLFCPKDEFLSMFNPAYLVENMGSDGRNLVLRHLQPTPHETVLEQIGTYATHLEGLDLTTNDPGQMIKNCRLAIRDIEQQQDSLAGSITAIQDAIKESEGKLDTLYADKFRVEETVRSLEEKQFRDIDREALAVEKTLLTQKLADAAHSNGNSADALREKLEQVQGREYVSKYTKPLAEVEARIEILSDKYKRLAARIRGLSPNMQCPTCFVTITEENLESVKQGLMKEAQDIAKQGQEAVAQKNEILELDKKSRQVFEQFKEEDLKKISDQLSVATQATESIDPTKAQERLQEIEEQLIYGNLSDAEYSGLSCAKAELIGIEAQIKTLQELSDTKRLDEAHALQQVYAEQIKKHRDLQSALTEYVCKRTELATADLKMPNVSIRLFDIIRTTGEVKNVFKFNYKGRDYSTLSLSEKTRAGTEIAAMMRNVIGVDCPICVDNTESVAGFDNSVLPSQTFLLRFVKGQPLTVQSRSNLQPLQKAS